jgi:uncharacterized ferritin-like protein (DUF455 family)
MISLCSVERMQVQEFAESVLFGTSLDAKLRHPESLVDDDPGTGLIAPAQPGRPSNLKFRTGPSNSDFPGLGALEDEQRRGKLLHFFANHELLATELMALVLLKFPNAPKAFRAGILQTLKEEQQHTRMYMRRLEQLGVEFGDHSVNGYFWRAISTVETPMDYVSRLSLTFEQANLDYTRFFAGQFEQIGDEATRGLLDRIYHDEIGHVGYGLKWFRKWKDPKLSDWEAFTAQLTLPLSPTRAKGYIFNAEGRLAAGIDQEFIDELFVYSRSKGRSPDVYLFNPLAESFISRPDFEPNTRQAALAHDLETLPQFLCGRDDVVLVSRRPNSAFRAELKQAGFELPEFVELQDGRLAKDNELRSRKLSGLRPWAWSPDSIEVMEPLFGHLGQTALPAGADWVEQIRPLFSKARSADLLTSLHQRFSGDELMVGRLCPVGQTGVLAEDLETAIERIETIRRTRHHRVVAKALFGVAGGNQLRLWESGITDVQINWLRRVVETEGGVMIEPWLDRVLDFSFQFEADESDIKKVGLVKMANDPRGQYLASISTPRFAQNLTPELAELIRERSRDLLFELHSELADILKELLRGTGFRGALGVDAFIYRQPDGELRIHPAVELNARFTMGRMMLEVMRAVAPGRCGQMELVGKAALKKSGCESFVAYAEHLKATRPLKFQGHPNPKIVSGALCLTDPSVTRACLATLVVE